MRSSRVWTSIGTRPGARRTPRRHARRRPCRTPTIKRSFRAPGPWTTMIWRVLLTCLLTPGGRARPGPGRVQFRPRLARTTREHQAPQRTLNSQFRTQVTSRLPLPQLRFVITNLISHPRDPPLGPLIPPHATLSVQPQPFPLFPARGATRRNLQRSWGGPIRLVFLCVVMRVSCGTRARASWHSRSWCVQCVRATPGMC